jgi:DNA helicase-2/ATP-dependent DNA helicase PcrA
MFDLVMDYYRPVFERIYHDDYPRRSRDLEQLKIIMAGYAELQTFLDDTSLDPPQAAADAKSDAADRNNRLILSTIHSAKGLEWDTVFVINLANGRFPSSQASLPEHFEEERRLLYVAATRAKKALYLVYPLEVQMPDPYGLRGGISPFLESVPRNLVSLSEPHYHGFSRPEPETYKAAPAWQAVTGSASEKPGAAGELRPGTRVRHHFFGEGTVDSVAGGRTVKVFFARHGLKALHLDYAKLEVLG